MNQTPCKDCCSRTATCHVDCDIYAAYRQQREEVYAVREMYGIKMHDIHALKDRKYHRIRNYKHIK